MPDVPVNSEELRARCRAIAREYASATVPYCAATDKYRFVSQARAERCAREIVAVGGEAMRAYRCGFGRRFGGGHWHLTSIMLGELSA